MLTGAKSRRANFLRRFKVYVRRTIYFERWVAALGPAYGDCAPAPSCQSREGKKQHADPRNGCPKCKYTIGYKRYEEETLAEIAGKSPGKWADDKWPISELRRTLNVVARAHAAHRNTISRSWSVTTAALVDVYRGEIARMRGIDSWNLRQKVGDSDDDPPPTSRGARGQQRKRTVSHDEDLDDEE